MIVVKWLYEKIKGKSAPYYYNYSLLTILAKPLRKFIAQVLAPNCPFNNVRIALYRLCGFKIGKRCFIGMRCYLDDVAYENLVIGDHVTISYGVFFACHGIKQSHHSIIISEDAYIGMRSCVISTKKDGVTIGKSVIIGACSLVNKSLPDGVTAAGVPCRVIKNSKEGL